MGTETPLGFNPVGEHALGLPQHDKQLPGHASGTYAPIGDDSFGSTGGGGAFNFGDAGLPLNTRVPVGNPGWPPGFGIWSSRVLIGAVTYLTLPIQLGLYPIAGIPAFAVGYVVYHAQLATSVGFDASMGSAWFSAWLALLFAMRFDTGFEERNPGYRNIRHVLRLALLAIWMFYFDVTDHGDPAIISLIVALLTAAIGHFILRSKWLRWVWGNLEFSAWLRKERPPLPV